MIETPNIPHEALGITDNHVRYTVPVRRDIWTVFQRQPAVQLHRRPVWRPVLTTFDESEAPAFLADVPTDSRPHYRIVKGFVWEVREVWIDRADLPTEGARDGSE